MKKFFITAIKQKNIKQMISFILEYQKQNTDSLLKIILHDIIGKISLYLLLEELEYSKINLNKEKENVINYIKGYKMIFTSPITKNSIKKYFLINEPDYFHHIDNIIITNLVMPQKIYTFFSKNITITINQNLEGYYAYNILEEKCQSGLMDQSRKLST